MAAKVPADTGPSPGTSPVAPVASGSTPDQTGASAASPGAKETAAKFGGNPTGRRPQGKFKFPASTPEGKEERKRADAQRKKRDRQQEEPPTLPSVESVSDQVETSPGVKGPGPVDPAGETFVAWTEDDVRGFTDELVDLSEAKRIDDFVTIAKEARLPASLIKELERDARYPSATKAGLKTSIARTAAKWLNKSGVSAKNKEEAALLFFSATIFLQGRRLRSRLEALIAEDAAEREKTAGRAGGPAQTYTLTPPGSTPGPATKTNDRKTTP